MDVRLKRTQGLILNLWVVYNLSGLENQPAFSNHPACQSFPCASVLIFGLVSVSIINVVDLENELMGLVWCSQAELSMVEVAFSSFWPSSVGTWHCQKGAQGGTKEPLRRESTEPLGRRESRERLLCRES